MQALVTLNQDKTAITTSKVVADEFDKEHREVLRIIRTIIEEEGGVLHSPLSKQAKLTSYISEQNKELPCYELTRDGFMFVVLALKGKKARATQWRFIDGFSQMEATLVQVGQLQHSDIKSLEETVAEAECKDRLLEIKENALKRRISNRLDIAKMMNQSFDINEFLSNDKSNLPADVLMDMKLTMGEEIATYGSLDLDRKSLGALLEEHDIDMSAAKMNSEVLLPLGLIDTNRKVLAKGKYFGTNDIASSAKGTTSPRWFTSRFPELITYLKEQNAL